VSLYVPNYTSLSRTTYVSGVGSHLVLTVGEPMRAIGTGSRRAWVREVIISKRRPRHTSVVDDEALVMPPGGSVGLTDRAARGHTSGACAS
jgi:hypothetical protein